MLTKSGTKLPLISACERLDLVLNFFSNLTRKDALLSSILQLVDALKAQHFLSPDFAVRNEFNFKKIWIPATPSTYL